MGGTPGGACIARGGWAAREGCCGTCHEGDGSPLSRCQGVALRKLDASPGRRAPRRVAWLRRKLDVAEAKLDVGLSVEVRGGHPCRCRWMRRERGEDATVQRRSESIDAIWSSPAAPRYLSEAAGPATAKTPSDSGSNGMRPPVALRDASGSLTSRRSRRRRAARRRAKGAGRRLERDALAADAQRSALGDAVAEIERHAARIGELERRLHGVDTALVEAAAGAHGARRGRRSPRRRPTRNRSARRLRDCAHEAALRERATADPRGAAILNVDAEVMALEGAMADLDRRQRNLAEARGC